MGVDIKVIAGHEFQKQDIIELPSRINTWSDIEWPYSKDDKPAIWQTEINPELLEKVWIWRERRGAIRIPINAETNWLQSKYGWFYVNRNTIAFTPWPFHKYACLQDPEIAKSVISLVRLLFTKLSATEVLYCVDSGFKTALIEEYANYGLSYLELKQFATDNFGPSPKKIVEGLPNLWFIDDFNDDLKDLTFWNWQDVNPTL